VAFDLPADYWIRYLDDVEKIGPDEVAAAARKYLRPGEAAIAVVGDAASLEKDLAKQGRVERTKGP
jgi:predicted Zn-dependent peptidase